MWDSRGGGFGGNAPEYPNNGQNRERIEGGGNPNGGNPNWGEPGYRPEWRNSEYYRQYGHGFGTDEAIRVCRDGVYEQARRRFRTADIHFLRTRIDDNPGRNDWVIGSIDVHSNRPGEVYNFSCSVNFNNGRVRSLEIDARPIGWIRAGGNGVIDRQSVADRRGSPLARAFALRVKEVTRRVSRSKWLTVNRPRTEAIRSSGMAAQTVWGSHAGDPL